MRAGSYAVAAQAKVNLGLAILTRRGDGYHEIESLFARIALADDVVVHVSQGGGSGEGVTLDVSLAPAGNAAAVAATEVPQGPDNLAYAAAAAYLDARSTDRVPVAGEDSAGPRGVRIGLTKRVPTAAGLGGGSADAAAVLALLRHADGLAGYEMPAELLQQVALQVGSDVPFLLSGAPAAVGRGRGERLNPTNLPPLDLLLVNPGLPMSAAEAYAGLMGFTPRLRAERALERLAQGIDPGWSNGLQPGVLRRAPLLRKVLTRLRQAGLKGVVMSGSGATCLGVAEDAAAAEKLAEELRVEQPEWWVSVTRTLTEAEVGQPAQLA